MSNFPNVCYSLMNYFYNSSFTNSYFYKINFCFVNEIFKFFNIFSKRTYIIVKVVHSTFMVEIVKSLNFINIIILTVNGFFNLYFAEKRNY